VSRTSIPLNTETKDRLSELKRDDETWDEFFDRLLSENSDGMAPGTLSDEEADKMMDVVREGRDR
jgi:lipase chaperone LimK